MFSIAVPVVDDVQTLDDIIAVKHKAARARMRAVQKAVSTAYSTYPPSPIKPIGLAADVAEDFKDSFTVNGSHMAAQRTVIFDSHESAAGSLCPMCGIGDVLPLDHCLPREGFPEYSVLSKNLVPICTRCNTLKSALWQSVGGARVFFHP